MSIFNSNQSPVLHTLRVSRTKKVGLLAKEKRWRNQRDEVRISASGTMLQPMPTNDFDDLISAPIGGSRGHNPVEIGIDQNLLGFENQDLSRMNWGDEEFVGAHAPEVPVETVGKESTGKLFRLYPATSYLRRLRLSTTQR